jgi:plastocyanin
VVPEQDDEGRYIVEMVGQKFVPKDIRIPENSTVVWKYVSGKPHDVTADDGSFSSDDEGGKLGVGPTEYTHTFHESGEWKYYCFVHHSQGMVGSVLVE